MIESLILKYEPEYSQINDYTEDEVDALKNLPKKKFLLDCEQKFYAYSGLVDILFAYCYNERVNCGESNVECGWTIAKMSSTLSWLDVLIYIYNVFYYFLINFLILRHLNHLIKL